MSIYSDKLAHKEVVINCQYSVAQMCTSEDMLAHYLGAPFIDDVMRYNTLITSIAPSRVFIRGLNIIKQEANLKCPNKILPFQWSQPLHFGKQP